MKHQKSHKEVEIEAPNRIHITLLAMDKPVYRINGGIGFSINCLNLKIKVIHSNVFQIIDHRKLKADPRDIENLLVRLLKIKEIYRTLAYAQIDILAGPPPHKGFGAGTTMALSIIEGCLLLSGINISQKELVKISLRGGTSGIGINTYFNGGYVFDCGHKYIGQTHKPSSSYRGTAEPPLKLIQEKFPDWTIGIFLPNTISGLHYDSEIDFFDMVCPISSSETAEILYHSTFGVTCSVKEYDKRNFCKSINNIQKTKWKSEEVNTHGNEFLKTFNFIQGITLAAGMSSLGPLIYFISEDFSAVKSKIENHSLCGTVYEAAPNNCGRIIKYV